MSENSVKSGDYVRLKVNGKVCKVVIAKDNCEMIAIDEGCVVASTTFIKDVERIDPKTAFLTELSELLRKYDAGINASWDEYYDDGCPKIDIDVIFNGNVEGICFENMLGKTLTADNVLNYDK